MRKKNKSEQIDTLKLIRGVMMITSGIIIVRAALNKTKKDI